MLGSVRTVWKARLFDCLTGVVFCGADDVGS